MISLAHPTLPDLSPPELVHVAANTGYDAVGFRVVGLDAKTAEASIFKDEALLRATAAALESSGVSVLDVEVIAIGPDTRAADFRPLFEAGSRLGARYVVAVSMDSDEARVIQRYGELCTLAQTYGLGIAFEFMMRGGIRTLDAAHRVVTGAGCSNGGVLVDALHFYRAGTTVADLAGLDPGLFPYMQINDVQDLEAARSASPSASVRKVLPGTGDLRLSELLQPLPNGIPIAVVKVDYDSVGVDAPADLKRVEQILKRTAEKAS